MIFVTIGTSNPFDRLLRAAATLETEEELVVQTGASSFRPPGAKCVDFLPYAELARYVGDARCVIAHAGVGSVLTALTYGKRPIVVPRLKKLGEAVDDHQFAFARRLDEEGLVTLLEDERQLADAVARNLDSVATPIESGSGLIEELRAYLTAHARSKGGLSLA
jgi:UDP-N-acetylglucosamine transferase subunit ALG13